MADGGYIGEEWKRCLFKNQESADRIWERQNRIFMETFSREQGVSNLTETNAKKVFWPST